MKKYFNTKQNIAQNKKYQKQEQRLNITYKIFTIKKN